MIYHFIIYLLFFLSGLSALIYQVLWVRSFSLIFGGSHMAVTIVLSVFMGGLALGGFLGRHTDRSARPLRIYGLLEVGIGIAAIILIGLLRIYPDMYVAFSRMLGNQPAILSFGRILFAASALLVPTTLMGLTLPTLSGFATRQKGNIGRHLAFLYGINTFGAVAGALAAGFFLLRHFTVTTTFWLAIGISLLGGVVSLFLDSRSAGILTPASRQKRKKTAEEVPETTPLHQGTEKPIPARLILIGIGISGFCALGYEVLWTRVLSMVIGTTVYSYTLMLVAFLIGLAAGGASYRVLLRVLGPIGQNIGRSVLCFGLIQVTIGLLAFLVSYALRSLPHQAVLVETILQQWLDSGSTFVQTTNFAMAVIYMLVPAFFMGLAFPLAGDIVSQARGGIGKAVGETLTYNTVGAILGAAVSGFLLIHLFGIERSLQYISLLNLGLGMAVGASLIKPRIAPWGAATVSGALMLSLVAFPDFLRFWDTNYFAIFNHNYRQAFSNEEDRADIFENREVLYYAEGTTSTISVVKVKGGTQSVRVNGKTVSSTIRKDLQCVYTLGHLPMLLHKGPKKVWVLGMGTGITAGATTVHPGVESVTIVELEKHVPPAARTFSAYNHEFLSNPIVKVVFNDGRNFLLTTEEKYDVITADPIHPWSQGAAYLYTDEYYRLAASRLRSGGIMCQWLPIYELSSRDLQSVMKTFSNNFQYVYVWLTDYDAEIIGSNEPIDIDVDTLQQRMEGSPRVLADLQQIGMGSAGEFLSYCIMGPTASRNYGKDAPLNTDNNLYLEFSAPDSKDNFETVNRNIASLSKHREDITPYFSGKTLYSELGTDPVRFQHAALVYDQAHQMHYQGKFDHPVYQRLMNTLERQYPWFAPGRFLLDEYRTIRSRVPQLLDDIQLTLSNQDGTSQVVTLSAVRIKVSPERVKLTIVDNHERKIYGFIYIDGEIDEIDQLVAKQGRQVVRLIDTVYQKEKTAYTYPSALVTLKKIKFAIESFGREWKESLDKHTIDRL